MTITLKQFRALEWRQVYAYGDEKKGFKVFGCDAFPGITVTHDVAAGRVHKITYRTHKRTTTSPSQAVKWHNHYARIAAGGAQAPGSAQSLKDEQAARL